MAANKKSYDELSISEKIEAKKKKIKRLFREMPPEKRQFAEGLINQFAVTSVTLERLADEINNGDLIEDFVQGAQKLRRESPALRAYNTTIKSFSALTNQLVALLPEKISTHAPLAGRDSKSVQITMHIFAITDKFQMLLHRMPPVRAFCSFLMQENHADFGCEPPK